MRVFKRVPRHVEHSLHQLFTRCDICGEQTNTALYADDEVQIEARVGDRYPESDEDTREVAIADFCGKCFQEKVKPALVAIGVRFREFKGYEKEPKIVDGQVES